MARRAGVKPEVQPREESVLEPRSDYQQYQDATAEDAANEDGGEPEDTESGVEEV